MNILPLQSQYIFSLLLFMISKRDLYKFNFEIHGINTRHGSHIKSFIFIPWILTGLQNPYGYENSNICL